MKTLEQEWIQYRNACYPGKVGELQLAETRQAFYSGCFIAITKMVVMAEQDKAEDQIMIELAALLLEATNAIRDRIHSMKGRN